MSSLLEKDPSRLVAVDTETTGLDLRHKCRPFYLSTCNANGYVKSWQWEVNPETRKPKIPPTDRARIAKYLTGKTLVFHHAKFDLRAIASIGIGFDFSDQDFPVLPEPRRGRKPYIACCRRFHDTLLASHTLASADDHQLKSLAVKYLGYSDQDEQRLKKETARATNWAKNKFPKLALGHSPTGKRQTGYDYWLVSLRAQYTKHEDLLAVYGDKDVERTILLWLLFADLLASSDYADSLLAYYREVKLLQTVYRMETGGISIHSKRIQTKIDDLSTKIEDLSQLPQRTISKALDRPVNLNSPKDLQEYFYQNQRLPVPHRTPKGQPSLDRDALEALAETAETDRKFKKKRNLKQTLHNILLIRSYDSGCKQLKNYEAYAQPLHSFSQKSPLRQSYPKRIPKTYGILFPSLNQTGTNTTRFSSSNPNGQNVSVVNHLEIGDEEYEGPKLREVFGPVPGRIWYSIDYSQLELRIFAAASKEQAMIDALAEGHDFHSYVSTRMTGKAIEEITKQERRTAKGINFGLIFGAGRAKIDRLAGAGAYDHYSKQFPNVNRFMRATIARVKEEGKISTLAGYPLEVPLDKAYKAVNYLVQGTAGDIIKNAMIEIDESCLVDWINTRIVLQIHDELIVERSKNLFESEEENTVWLFQIMEAMENEGKKLDILTPVSCEVITKDWGHGKPIEVTLKEVLSA